jgi:NADH-quinone oxidoreductase subunit E
MASPLLTAEEQRVFDDRLAEILAHYPSDRKSAAMLPALHLLQSMKGWLPPDGMEMVARKLEVSPERAYEVATFYVMFHTKKPGKYVVDVCTNLSCSLWGAEELLSYLEQKLGVRSGEATEPGPSARPSASRPAAPPPACRSTRSITRTSGRARRWTQSSPG